jgi:hypothetical protein
VVLMALLAARGSKLEAFFKKKLKPANAASAY